MFSPFGHRLKESWSQLETIWTLQNFSEPRILWSAPPFETGTNRFAVMLSSDAEDIEVLEAPKNLAGYETRTG